MHAAESKLIKNLPPAVRQMVEDEIEKASNTPPRAILLVDDEQPVLSSLKRLLRREDFPVITASSGTEALQLLKINDVAVVVSDYRMPEMNGVEFLDQVREMYPDTRRIILTGQADMETVVGAVNSGAVSKYVTKPWQTKELAQELRDTYRQHSLEEEKLRVSRAMQCVHLELNDKSAPGSTQNH